MAGSTAGDAVGAMEKEAESWAQGEPPETGGRRGGPERDTAGAAKASKAWGSGSGGDAAAHTGKPAWDSEAV